MTGVENRGSVQLPVPERLLTEETKRRIGVGVAKSYAEIPARQERDRQVARVRAMLRRGMTAGQISEELGVKEGRVKYLIELAGGQEGDERQE